MRFNNGDKILVGSRITVLLRTELDVDLLRDQPLLPALVQQPLYGRASPIAVLEGQAVHVHTDEAVCPRAVETAAEPHGVLNRYGGPLQAGAEAGMEQPRAV